MSDPLIAALTGTPRGEGRTTKELLGDMEWPDTTFYRNKLLARLRPKVIAGEVVCEAGERPRIDGRPSKVPVYRLA